MKHKRNLRLLLKWLGPLKPRIVFKPLKGISGYINDTSTVIYVNNKKESSSWILTTIIHEYIHFLASLYNIKGYKFEGNYIEIANLNDMFKVVDLIKSDLLIETHTELLTLLIYIEFCRQHDIVCDNINFSNYLDANEDDLIEDTFKRIYKEK